MEIKTAEPEAPEAAVFMDYPKQMVHPHARRASSEGVKGTEITDSMGRPIPGQFREWRGTADFMPPVVATCEDEENYYRSQGYGLGGSSSAAAFANMTARNGSDPIPVIERYPMWLGGVLVNNAQEEAAQQALMAPVLAAVESSKETPRHTPTPADKKPRSEKQLANDARLAARKKSDL